MSFVPDENDELSLKALIVIRLACLHYSDELKLTHEMLEKTLIHIALRFGKNITNFYFYFYN